MSKPVSITTQHNIDDCWEDLSQWMKNIAPVWDLPASTHWELDLSSCRYLGPFAATILYSSWLWGKQLGQNPKIILPIEPEPLAAFCKFSNLDHFLRKKPQADPRNPNSETVPLSRFFDRATEQSLRPLNLVTRHTHLTPEDKDRLTISINEVCQNIEDHAQSIIGGVSCARYFSSKREVRVAVVDRGITIASSLQKANLISNEHDALKRVIEGGTTSQSKKHNKGLGISNLVGFVKAMNGSLILLSGTSAAILFKATEDFRFIELGWRFPGTGVFFTLEVSQADDHHDEP